jgi:hypothetical protein
MELKGKEAVGAPTKQNWLRQGFSSDEVEYIATSTGCPETLLATKVVEPHSTPPSTKVATLAKLVASHRRHNKQRES